MSTHRLSGSGNRQYTIAAGGGAMTGATLNALQGDRITGSLGSLTEFHLMLPPKGAEIRRMTRKTRDGEDEEFLVLVIESQSHYETKDGPVRAPGVHVSFDAISGGGHPHTNFDVRKDDEKVPFDYYAANAETVEVIPILHTEHQEATVES